eukprot:g70549.t1
MIIEGEMENHRNITISTHTRALRNIHESNKHYDPLAFSLLFPEGEQGWNYNLLANHQHNPKKTTRITPTQYYSGKMFARGANSLLHKSGRLFQQYTVDACVKVQQQRLRFVENNQNQLRADSIRGFLEAVDNDDVANLGKNHPSCNICRKWEVSPRTVPRCYGVGTSKENAATRHDIVARVFKLKLQAMEDDIYKKRVFENDKLKNTDQYDLAIQAELPDPVSHPTLYSLLQKHQMHGAKNRDNQRTCKWYSYVESDNIWGETMQEATTYQMPKQMRQLFVIILLAPSNPRDIWETYKPHLAEDFRRMHDENDSYTLALHDIATLLQNTTLSDYNLPTVTTAQLERLTGGTKTKICKNCSYSQ